MLGCNLYPLLAFLASLPSFSRPLIPRAVSQPASQTANAQWTQFQDGTTGVSAMQLTVISEEYAVLVDKVQHNPLEINRHPTWSALYNCKRVGPSSDLSQMLKQPLFRIFALGFEDGINLKKPRPNCEIRFAPGPESSYYLSKIFAQNSNEAVI